MTAIGTAILISALIGLALIAYGLRQMRGGIRDLKKVGQTLTQAGSDSEPRLTGRFDSALVIASTLHRNQVRKGSDIPYVAHLMAVAALVLEHGGDEDQAIAALLHDAVEDQGGANTLAVIRERFGDRVARIVSDCTDAWEEPKPPWRPRKEAYLAELPNKDPDSLLVSLADKVHNAKAIRDDYRDLGEELWSRFRGRKEGTIWYYQELSQIFVEVLPGRLADELAEIVRDLESEAGD